MAGAGPRPSDPTPQIEVGPTPFGSGRTCRQRRRKPLKTGRFPAGLLLVPDQVQAYRFSPEL
jgi:hypothetical protein